MSLSRRSLFAALPAVPLFLRETEVQAALPSPAQTVPLLHPWQMVEHLTIQEFKDTIFEKPVGSESYIIGEEGLNILQVSRPHRVIVPMGWWTRWGRGGNEPVEPAGSKGVIERLNAVVSAAVLHSPRTMTKDFSQQIGDADRACRDPEPKVGAPDLYILSKGPIGYVLTDAKDPDTHGLVVFSHRIRVVGVEGSPVHA